MSIINCSTNSKSFKAIFFFFEIHRFKSLEKTSQFCFLAFITFFQLLLGSVFIFKILKIFFQNDFEATSNIVIFRFFKSNERSEDSKVLVIFSGKP